MDFSYVSSPHQPLTLQTCLLTFKPLNYHTRTMPIQIRNSLNNVDRARFQVHAADFESYITNHPRHQVQVGERNHERMEVVEFDNAEITYVMCVVAQVWPAN